MGGGSGAPARGRRHAVGTRRRADAVAVDGDATVEAPARFAPGFENCRIQYEFRRGPSLQGSMVSLTIKDRDDHTIHHSGVIGLGRDRRDWFEWDGRDDTGNYVTPQKSPFTVTLRVGNAITRTRQIRVELHNIVIWTRTTNQRIYMNDPAQMLDTAATVQIKSTNGPGVRAYMPVEVKFAFIAGGSNLTVNDSYEYNTGSHLKLGKRDLANAVFWEANARCTTASDDSFRQTCRVRTLDSGADRGKAFVKFKPSGVGGDTFRIRATVYWGDGTTVMMDRRGPVLTVWRRVDFRAYEMQHTGQRHVSRHGTDAIMGTYYTGDTYVYYHLGRVTAIGNAHCVRYIGLWDHANNRMHDWNTMKRKSAANNEVPAAADIPKSNLPGANAAEIAARDAARNRIQACANRWRDRIIRAYDSGLDHWASDAGVPRNSMVSIEYEHPKYSAAAPNADAITDEWSDPDLHWLEITVEGFDVGPDELWVDGEGLSRDERAYITAGMSQAETRITIAHEAGHETKNQFERARFRPASVGGRPEDRDHTPVSGLMESTGNRASFTAGEKQVLRGFANP